MKTAALVVFIVAIAEPLLTAQAQPARTITITGRVLADDGEPIANVRVAAISTALSAPVALTDDEGRFTLTAAADAPRIAASKTGYGRREVARPTSALSIEIRLQRGAAISGRVVDEVGEPVQAARVSAYDASVLSRSADGAPASGVPAGPPPPPGRPAPSGVAAIATTDTDDRGEYRLASLPAGTYAILTNVSGGLTPTRMGPNQFAMVPQLQQVYYPGTTTASEAQPIRLEPGDDRPGVDFVVAGARSGGRLNNFPISPLAQPPAPRVGQTANGIIRGQVVGTDGRSLPYAQVHLFLERDPRQQLNARADSDARFEFRDLPAGTYRLAAAKTGYGPVAASESARNPFSIMPTIAVTIAGGETRERADIPLSRWGTLTGRVLDERGEPLQGASVQVLQVRYELGRRRLASAGISRPTDDLGRYRLFSVPPGPYVISAAVGDVQSADLPGYARAYYPGTSDPAQAQLVSIGLSQDLTGIDFLMSRTRTARISGRLINAAGEPGLGGSLMLIPSRRSTSLTNVSVGARIRPDGEFEFANVPPGQYIIQSDRGRSNGWTEGEFGTMPVSVDGTDVRDLVLQTSLGSTVHGHFTFEAVDATKRPPRSDLQLSPAPVDFDLAPPSFASADIHDDWTFDMGGVNGPRRLQLLRAPAGWALEDVRVNGISVADRALAFGRRDQSLADVEVVLTDRLSEVAGTITDAVDRPAPGSAVIVFASDRDRWYPFSRYLRTASAGADGAFSVTGLPFGTYYAAAVARLPNEGDDAWQDPEFLNTLVPRASTVTAREGQKQSIALRLSGR